ncbi:hypothetical protein PS634_01470 [Pseudomonas fluorescens]|nr:hypothetical protein PS634_01470 [Pseudomonas fluorescens]
MPCGAAFGEIQRDDENVTRSVTGGMPTRSEGTIINLALIVPTLCVITPLRTLRVR